jgi:Xaa-Pro aminopeptidase
LDTFGTETNIPELEIDSRVAAIQRHLIERDIDAALILQNADLYYFSGTLQQGHFYIPAEAEPVLAIRKSFSRATAESSIRNIVPINNLSQMPSIIHKNDLPLPKTLGLELDVLPANHYLNLKKLFDSSQIVDISHVIRMIRAVKSPFEMTLIRRASALADQVAAYAGEVLQAGMTEVELAGILEARARKLGHQGMIRMRLWGGEMFYGHLMSGASAAIPSSLSSPTGGTALSPAFPQGSGFNKIRSHEPILFDYIFAYNGYLADHTRIFSIGELAPELVQAHGTMLNLQAIIADMAVPGAITGDIYETALAFVADAGYADFFMGAESQRIRFIGHGLGLEADEYPFLAKGQSMKLRRGMVLALEPKLVIPGKGVVGIENTHVVTDRGLEQLTKYEEGVILV